MKNAILSLFSIAALAACSGGGGSDPAPSSSTPPPANEGSTNDFIVLSSLPRVESSETDSEETSEMAENPFLADGFWYGHIRDAWGYMRSYHVLCFRDGSDADCLVMQDGLVLGWMKGQLSIGSQEPEPDVSVAFDVHVPDLPDAIASTSGLARMLTSAASFEAKLDYERYVLFLQHPIGNVIDTPSHPLASVYTYANVNGETSSLSIDGDGSLFAQTESGCIYSGSINGREIELTVANCGEANGQYTGLALHAFPLYVRAPQGLIPNSMVAFAAYGNGRYITGYGLIP